MWICATVLRVFFVGVLLALAFAQSSRGDVRGELPGGDANHSSQYFAENDQTPPGWYFEASSWRIKRGDDPSWADAELDESDWQLPQPKDGIFYEGPFDDIPDGIFWVRVKVVINANWVRRRIDSICNQIKGAREIYWDGRMIDSSGVVGLNRGSETPGLNIHWASIPEQLLTPGVHQIAVRVSSNYPKPVDGPIFDTFKLTDDSFEIPDDLSNAYILRYMFGFTVGIAVIYLLVYLFAERKASYALFSGLSGSLALLMYLSFYEFSHTESFTYDRLATVRHVSLGCAYVFSLLVPGFLVVHFSKKWIHIIWIGFALAVPFFLSPVFDARVNLLLVIGGLCGFLIAAWGAWEKKPGSLLILAGFFLFLLSMLLAGVESVLLGHIGLVFCVFSALTVQIGKDKVTHQKLLIIQADLKASKARLETELIKRSLQPHFLMNTLNALVDWIEENPRKSIHLVHDLGDHFRILLDVSGEREIKIGKEIQLAESFLRIMGFRKEVSFKLHVENVNTGDNIPPCVLHTLIENAVTHNRYTGSEIEFRLEGSYQEDLRSYTLDTPIEKATGSVLVKNKASGGTGLKYVRSRLEESYPGRWKLRSGRVDDQWVTRIEITNSVQSEQGRRGCA